MMCSLCGKEMNPEEYAITRFGRKYHALCFRLAEDAEEEAMKTG